MNVFEEIDAQIAALECCEYQSIKDDEDISEGENDPLHEFIARPTPAPRVNDTKPPITERIIIDLTSDDGNVKLEAFPPMRLPSLFLPEMGS